MIINNEPELRLSDEEIYLYLTGMITLWKEKRDNPKDPLHRDLKEIAPYYIDAYQAIKTTLFFR